MKRFLSLAILFGFFAMVSGCSEPAPSTPATPAKTDAAAPATDKAAEAK